jgi:hypothetical protein
LSLWQVVVLFKILKQEDRRIEIINSIGERCDNTTFGYIQKRAVVSELLATLIDWFVRDPHLLGILNIISSVIASAGQNQNLNHAWSFYEFRQFLSHSNLELLYSGKSDSIIHQKAKIIVALAKNDLTISDIDNIVRKTLELMDDSSQTIHIILEIVEQRKFSDSISERFLEQLLAYIDKSKWQEYQKIIGSTDDFLNAKISALASQPKWNKLGLPSGTSHLLPE